jgi:hypothetical protein
VGASPAIFLSVSPWDLGREGVHSTVERETDQLKNADANSNIVVLSQRTGGGVGATHVHVLDEWPERGESEVASG